MSDQDKKLPVIELFGPTIQGEGAVIGQQTYFLRLGLCDFKCEMCDSLHAVLPQLVKQNAEWLTQAQIASKIAAFVKPETTPWITISGGNPCIHDLTNLVDYLHDMGMLVHVETQGTKSPDWLQLVDMLTVSPKGPGMGEKGFKLAELDAFMDIAANQWDNVDAVKVVIFDQRDLEFAKDIFARYIDQGWIIPAQCYLSLGNMYPPPINPETKLPDGNEHMKALLDAYRIMCEDIMYDPILSQVIFLPQWHVFVWGNAQGH